MVDINVALNTVIQGMRKYNSGIFVNDKKADSQVAEIINRCESDMREPEGVKEMCYVWNGSKLIMVPLFDIHIGGQGFRANRFKMVLDFVKNCRIARAYIGGDMFDNANLAGKTNPLLSKLNPSEQKVYSENLDLLNDVIGLGKVLFAIFGNHDGETDNRTKEANISLVKDFCIKKGIPFADYNALLNLYMLSPNGKEVLRSSHYVTHGSSASMSPALACSKEKEKMTNALLSAGLDPNIVDTVDFGHVHIDGSLSFTVKVPVEDENGKALPEKYKTLWVNCNPSMQGPNDFALKGNMRSAGTNAYATEISWIENPRYRANKDSEFPMQLHLSRYPVLSLNRDEYSLDAQEVLEDELYKENFEIEEILKNEYLINGKSLETDYPGINKI